MITMRSIAEPASYCSVSKAKRHNCGLYVVYRNDSCLKMLLGQILLKGFAK